MEIEIVSKEFIKPSSPTPAHLGTHYLSFLDQYIDIPNIYVTVVLFYLENGDSNRIQLLKQSLSKTITHFYPLAGRIKDCLSVDCNDEGIYCVEARVMNISLCEFLKQPDTTLISKFIPGEDSETKALVAMIQITTFSCGGMALGVSLSHLINDGTSFSTFLQSWTAIARDEEAFSCPNYEASSLFPQSEAYPKDVTVASLWGRFHRMGRNALRRFVLNGQAMASLKDKATNSIVSNPTRVEAASALLSKCIMAISRERSASTGQKSTLITHAVNLRRRAEPPFLENSMGNFALITTALCPYDDTELSDLVCRMRNSISKIDGDLMRKIQGDGGLHRFCDAVRDLHSSTTSSADADLISLTSWCNFGFYEADFGWGKPTWVTLVGVTAEIFINGVILMDTRSGDGVEAWASLGEEYMAKLEQNEEFLAFASVDPSPLTQLSETK